ncbi:MAG TPA: hypothetical protein VF516_39505 [Kofleriaceae bacterium]
MLLEAGRWCEVVWAFAVEVAAAYRAFTMASDLTVRLGDLSTSTIP